MLAITNDLKPYLWQHIQHNLSGPIEKEGVHPKAASGWTKIGFQALYLPNDRLDNNIFDALPDVWVIDTYSLHVAPQSFQTPLVPLTHCLIWIRLVCSLVLFVDAVVRQMHELVAKAFHRRRIPLTRLTETYLSQWNGFYNNKKVNFIISFYRSDYGLQHLRHCIQTVRRISVKHKARERQKKTLLVKQFAFAVTHSLRWPFCYYISALTHVSYHAMQWWVEVTPGDGCI